MYLCSSGLSASPFSAQGLRSIYLLPVPVGVYELEAGIGRFAYAKSWLARTDAFPLDPAHLLLTSEEFTTANRDGLFSVLRDAGPDSWGLRVMAREHAGRQLTPVEQLLYAQGYGTGCLLFSASRDSIRMPPEISGWETLVRAQQGVDRLLAGESVSPDLLQLLEPGSSLGGARPKTTVRRAAGQFGIEAGRADEIIREIVGVVEGWENEMRRAGMNERDVALLKPCFAKSAAMG